MGVHMPLPEWARFLVTVTSEPQTSVSSAFDCACNFDKNLPLHKPLGLWLRTRAASLAPFIPEASSLDWVVTGYRLPTLSNLQTSIRDYAGLWESM